MTTMRRMLLLGCALAALLAVLGVVLTVAGSLVVAGGATTRALQDAQVQQARLMARKAENEVELHQVRDGRLPASLDDVLDPEDRLDPWGTPWRLEGHTVFSAGPDRAHGTADDIGG